MSSLGTGLFSPSVSPLRAIYVVNQVSSFLLLSSILCYECTIVNHLPTEGHVGCFESGATTNRAAVNIHAHTSVRTDDCVSLG